MLPELSGNEPSLEAAALALIEGERS